MTDFLNELNTIQRQAATCIQGPMLIVAGPGSGKTRVLTYRIAYLIEQGIPAYSILALTFTNKAAKEMKERIAKVVGDRGRSVMAGTFHSLFARFLRAEAERIGFPKDFTIYDSDDSRSLINKIVKERGLDSKQYGAQAILSRISNAKSNLVSPAGYRLKPELLEADRRGGLPQIVEIYTIYMDRLKKAGAMDFDDLLYYFFILLHQNEDIRAKYQKRFSQIMVDEFQDTNFLQYAILRKLTMYEGSPCNICAVGDDAQSIYAFRGATIDNIFDYQKDFKDIKIFKLEQNYRSTDHIVAAANTVIKRNNRQIQKTIWTESTGGNRIKVIKSMSDQEEAKRVVDLMMEHKNRYHLRNKDMAILYRTNAQSRVFEETLRRFNLPYRVYGGMSFYQRKEVKDLIAYLRIAVNPRDEEAMRRVINYPRRGIGDSLLDKVSGLAAQQGLSYWDAVQHFVGEPREMRSLATFVDIVNESIKLAQNGDADSAARQIYRLSTLQSELKSDASKEGLEKADLCESLLNGITEFTQSDELVFDDEEGNTDRSLVAYLQNIALVTDADKADPDADVVTLMSAHSAKGLEFVSVFVVGLEEKLFPSQRALDEPNGLDEERRLFYVAITRAEKFLTLSHAMSRYQFGQQKFYQPSRFITEIDAENLEQTTPLAGGLREPVKEGAPARSGVSGLTPRPMRKPAVPLPDAKDFVASPQELIVPGAEVLHLKFGWGKVLSIEGARDNRVATIDFSDLDDPTRKIMLKFAKLQVKS